MGSVRFIDSFVGGLTRPFAALNSSKMDDEKEANYSFLHFFMKNKLLIGGFDSSDCPPLLQ